MGKGSILHLESRCKQSGDGPAVEGIGTPRPDSEGAGDKASSLREEEGGDVQAGAPGPRSSSLRNPPRPEMSINQITHATSPLKPQRNVCVQVLLNRIPWQSVTSLLRSPAPFAWEFDRSFGQSPERSWRRPTAHRPRRRRTND